jgi:hypothetical protein
VLPVSDQSVCQKIKKRPCKTVWFCSTDCQRQLWKKQHAPDHKRILNEQEEERSKKQEQKKDTK